MKIGIMTFWWSEDNYGQLLQCYALQKYLGDNGHDPFLIRYDPRNDYIKKPFLIRVLYALNPIKLMHYLQRKKRVSAAIREQKDNGRGFDFFRNTYICQSDTVYASYQKLKDDPPEADMYIVGSDQVWNFNGKKLRNVVNVLHAYFLDFGLPSVKRASYAASWSVDRLGKDLFSEIRPLLKSFNYVSVREKEGVDLCHSLGVHSEWVPDPVFLNDPEVYRNLYRNTPLLEHKRPYVFAYILGNKCDFSMEKINDWAKDRNLDVIYVSGNNRFDNYPKTYASIPQWLRLIDNADYVITNSYHCCVFSALFHTSFAVIPMGKGMNGLNSRIESLWNLLSIEPRVLKRYDFTILDNPYEVKTTDYTKYIRQMLCGIERSDKKQDC